MLIAHVIKAMDQNEGGPSQSVTQLMDSLGRLNPEINFELHTGQSSNPVLSGFYLKHLQLSFYDRPFLGMLAGMGTDLKKNMPSLFHGHALWDLPVHQMAKTAQKEKVPYVISPRGMLEPWSLRQKKLKKKLALWLYQYNDLKMAACLHATAPMEATSLRALGLKNPVAVIPNGIPLQEFPLKARMANRKQKKLLFLSRIHPKKGIENLIEAFSLLPAPLIENWQLNIIGNGDPVYLKSLESQITKKGLSQHIIIKGPLFSSEKVTAYQDADLFILPTYSENFGIVVAEALACGTPVVTTKGAPWEDLESFSCGWWIDTGVPALKECLEHVLGLPQNKLEAMGKKGRRLVETKYSIEATAIKMHALYAWLLGKSKIPDFVLP